MSSSATMSEATPIANTGEGTPLPFLKKSNFRLIALCVFYLLFLVIGAAVFAAIEGPQEAAVLEHIRNVRRDFLMSHNSCLSGKNPRVFMSFLAACVLLHFIFFHHTPLCGRGHRFVL